MKITSVSCLTSRRLVVMLWKKTWKLIFILFEVNNIPPMLTMTSSLPAKADNYLISISSSVKLFTPWCLSGIIFLWESDMTHKNHNFFFLGLMQNLFFFHIPLSTHSWQYMEEVGENVKYIRRQYSIAGIWMGKFIWSWLWQKNVSAVRADCDYSMEECTSKPGLHNLFIKASRYREWSQLVSIRGSRQSRETEAVQMHFYLAELSSSEFCTSAGATLSLYM